MVLQVGLATLAMGCIYGAVALGFTLIWNAASVVNFAQGELVMIGAFLGAVFYATFKFPLGVAWVLAIASSFAVGILFERLVIRPVKRAEFWAAITTTMGASIVLSNMARIVWGPAPKPFPSFFSAQPITVNGVRFAPDSLFIIVVVLVLVVLQDVFFRHTLVGKAMKAVAMDRSTSELMGIKADRMVALTFGLSSGLAAAAGLLLAPTFSISYDMGLSITMKAFSATIIGGFGSVRGGVLGGLLIAVAETLIALLVSTDYKDALVFACVVLLLLVNPKGVLPTAQS